MGIRFRPQHILIIGWGRFGGVRPTIGAIQRAWGEGEEISSATYSHPRVRAIRRRARPTIGAVRRTWGEALSTRH